jgi:hypothetical protein
MLIPPPKAKPEDLVRTLDADDPLLRQRARSDLIALGQRAISTIEQTLTDPSAPYRVRVGVLSVLREMSQQAKQLLHEPARCAIAKMAEDPDGTLRAEAAGVIASGVAVSSTCPVASKAEASPGCKSEKVGDQEFTPLAFGEIKAPIYLFGQSKGRIVFGKIEAAAG